MRTTIAANERLQLIGLLAIAKHHNKWLTDIKESVQALLGINEATEDTIHRPSDHVSDAVYSDFDADTLLSRISVAVELPPADPAVDPVGELAKRDPTTRDEKDPA